MARNKINLRLLWGLIMVVVYFGMSFLLVFTNLFLSMSLVVRVAMGLVFSVYGVFRGYRIWKYGR